MKTAKQTQFPTATADDRTTLDDVLLHYQPLVLNIMRELSRVLRGTGVEPEDLQQEASASLIELTRQYTPERGTPFGSYLKQKLKWRLVNFLKRELKRNGRTAEMDEAEHLAEGAEALPSAEVLNPRLRAALRQLSPRQRSVLYEIYWRDKTAQEVARQLGISPQSVTALRRRAEARVRREMSE